MSEIPSTVPTHVHYRAVFISPHLDDAVFSCGGRIAQLQQEGPVLVLNLFTRYLADLKIHGAVMGEQRHQEERDAAEFLGFESRCLDELDAPFRRDAYRKLGNLFRPPCQQDLDWLPSLRDKLFGILTGMNFDELYVPLGIGWHVDHVLTYLTFETWADKEQLLYYEDAPYCCIPHATRYRLNDIANYPHDPCDHSLTATNELTAWWQVASAYADTTLMKNLQPWIVRQFAVPTISYYLFRLMTWHRRQAHLIKKHDLHPLVIPIAEQLNRKIAAMDLYHSQFGEFFSSRQECIATLSAYVKSTDNNHAMVERLWTVAISDT